MDDARRCAANGCRECQQAIERIVLFYNALQALRKLQPISVDNTGPSGTNAYEPLCGQLCIPFDGIQE